MSTTKDTTSAAAPRIPGPRGCLRGGRAVRRGRLRGLGGGLCVVRVRRVGGDGRVAGGRRGLRVPCGRRRLGRLGLRGLGIRGRRGLRGFRSRRRLGGLGGRGSLGGLGGRRRLGGLGDLGGGGSLGGLGGGGSLGGLGGRRSLGGLGGRRSLSGGCRRLGRSRRSGDVGSGGTLVLAVLSAGSGGGRLLL